MKNEYKVCGDITIIYINYRRRRIEALISTSDLARAQEYTGTWYGVKFKNSNTIYAVGNFKSEDGSRRLLLLHKHLLQPPKGMDVDHENRNGLDNTRENIRSLPHADNLQNTGTRSDNKSGVKGVSKLLDKWQVHTCIYKVRLFFGLYTHLSTAAAISALALATYHPYSDERSDLVELYQKCIAATKVEELGNKKAIQLLEDAKNLIGELAKVA